MKKINLYKTPERLERKLSAVSSAEISAENKKLILEFHDYIVAQGLSDSRLLRYLQSLENLAKWLDKDFSKADKKDLIKLVSGIERKEYAHLTKQLYKVMLKRFFKWLKGNDEFYPDEVRWIKTHSKKSRHKLPEELLSEEDITKLVLTADTPRDKALVEVLYESGCRIGEILNLRLKHVVFDDHGAVLMVSGKTGDRRVRVIASVSTLASWIDVHPIRDNPDSALWVIINPKKRRGEPFRYCTARAILKRLAQRAHLNKKITPHLFRHSRATSLANIMTEAQMKEYLGWTKDSDMASVYVHLSGRDVDAVLLKANGMEDKTIKKEESFKVKVCPRCSMNNSPVSKFCHTCGSVLDMQGVMEVENNRKTADSIMDLLVNDEDMKKLMVEKLAASGVTLPR